MCCALGSETIRTRRASRSDMSGTDACTGDFDFSSCRACSKALFSFRNRSSSSVSSAEVDSAAAGAAALRASRSSEIATDSFWADSRADFSWVVECEVCVACPVSQADFSTTKLSIPSLSDWSSVVPTRSYCNA